MTLKEEVRRARRRAVLSETRNGRKLILAEDNLIPILTRMFRAAAERQPYVYEPKVFVITTPEWFAVRTEPATLELHFSLRDLGLERHEFGLNELWKQLYLDSERYELEAISNGEGSFEFSIDLS